VIDQTVPFYGKAQERKKYVLIWTRGMLNFQLLC